jgi:hypothetical protein
MSFLLEHWDSIIGVIGAGYGAWQRYKRGRAEKTAQRTASDLQRILDESHKNEVLTEPDLPSNIPRVRL